MGKQRVKFATQVDEAILVDLRKLAKTEGRQLQSLVEEAIEKLLKERETGDMGSRIRDEANAASEKYNKTLKYLAK